MMAKMVTCLYAYLSPCLCPTILLNNFQKISPSHKFQQRYISSHRQDEVRGWNVQFGHILVPRRLPLKLHKLKVRKKKDSPKEKSDRLGNQKQWIFILCSIVISGIYLLHFFSFEANLQIGVEGYPCLHYFSLFSLLGIAFFPFYCS